MNTSESVPAQTALSRPHQDEGAASSGLVIALEAVGRDPPPPPRRPGGHRHRWRRLDRRPPGTLRLGHYAAARWRPATGEAPALAELFIGGEGLALGAVDVLGTLLHEAAHGVVFTRAIQGHQPRWDVPQRPLQAAGGGARPADRPSPRDRLVDDHRPGPDHRRLRRPGQAQLHAAIVHVRDSEHQVRPTGPGGTAGDGEESGEAGETTGSRSAPPTPAAARRRGGCAWRRPCTPWRRCSAAPASSRLPSTRRTARGGARSTSNPDRPSSAISRDSAPLEATPCRRGVDCLTGRKRRIATTRQPRLQATLPLVPLRSACKMKGYVS